jgi:endonuclease/exonuclease/phosphatase family metal-dependent hydrolase
MRLLSYNIHKGIGGRDRLYRIARILDVIEQENPDLLCLQEVDRGVPRSRFNDQPKILLEGLCAKGCSYQFNVRLKRGGYGNLLLSRWPFSEKHGISLGLPGKKPRGAQLVIVDSPEGPLQLINLHLGLGEKERHQQIRHLLGHHLFRCSGHLPTVIAGDTNDWRNTLAAGPLADNGFQHLTHPLSRYRTFPAYLPVGSLDKAYFRGGIRMTHARVVRSKVAKAASDHLPLVVDLHLVS